MATFPNVDRREVDDMRPDNGLSIVHAPDGYTYGQSLYVDVYQEFHVLFPNLTPAEADSIRQFEQDNRTVAFDYEYEIRGRLTVIYECIFLPPGVKIRETQTVIMGEAWFRGRIKP